jgi:hypothetical protein
MRCVRKEKLAGLVEPTSLAFFRANPTATSGCALGARALLHGPPSDNVGQRHALTSILVRLSRGALAMPRQVMARLGVSWNVSSSSVGATRMSPLPQIPHCAASLPEWSRRGKLKPYATHPHGCAFDVQSQGSEMLWPICTNGN